MTGTTLSALALSRLILQQCSVAATGSEHREGHAMREHTLGILAGVALLCALSMYGKSVSFRRPFTSASSVVNRRGVCCVYTFSTPCTLQLVTVRATSVQCSYCAGNEGPPEEAPACWQCHVLFLSCRSFQSSLQHSQPGCLTSAACSSAQLQGSGHCSPQGSSCASKHMSASDWHATRAGGEGLSTTHPQALLGHGGKA